MLKTPYSCLPRRYAFSLQFVKTNTAINRTIARLQAVRSRGGTNMQIIIPRTRALSTIGGPLDTALRQIVGLSTCRIE